MESVTVNSRDLSGKLKKSWKAEVVRDDGDLIELYGVFDFSFEHSHLGSVPIGMASYEYYWRSRWYNVFRFHEPDGSFRTFYCNVNMPPVMANGTLDYVDLDIDVIVSVTRETVVVDEDEFEQSAADFGYSAEIRTNVRAAVDEIISLAAAGRFPFELLNSVQQNIQGRV